VLKNLVKNATVEIGVLGRAHAKVAKTKQTETKHKQNGNKSEATIHTHTHTHRCNKTQSFTGCFSVLSCQKTVDSCSEVNTSSGAAPQGACR